MSITWKTKIVIVSAHFEENLEWYENSPYQVVISTNNTGFHKEFKNPLVSIDENCRARQNLGREASAYLRFIVTYYDNLPEYMAFLHGHETSWHQKYPGTLFEAIANANIEMYKHISLNLEFQHNLLRPGNHYWDSCRDLWPHHFEPVVGVSIPSHVEWMALCAQFVVHKEVILKYPKEQWVKWLSLTENQGSHHFNHVPWVFEYGWAVIFGEEWECDPHTYHEKRFNTQKPDL